MPRLPAPIRSALLCVAMASSTGVWAEAHAQDAVALGRSSPYVPATGQAWLDRHLADINLYAERYPQAFADEISRYYAVRRGYVEALLLQPAWTAGDVFMACALARRASQPCRNLVREWSRDHEQGWAGVAGRVDLEPGSAEYLQISEDVRSSYRRWSRPLLDN